MGAQVTRHNLSTVAETEAGGAGLQSLSGNFESNFVEQIPLVLLFDRRGVAGAVHQPREHVQIVSEVHAATIAELHGSDLSAEKYALRENFWGNIGGLEDNFLSLGRRMAGHCLSRLPGTDAQKQEPPENYKTREAHHGNAVHPLHRAQQPPPS